MKKILPFYLFMIPIIVIGQNQKLDDLLILLDEVELSTTILDNYLNEGKESPKGKNYIRSIERWERELFGGYFQKMYRVEIYKRKRLKNHYNLNIIRKNKKIIYFSLFDFKNNKYEKEGVRQGYVDLVQLHKDRLKINSKVDIKHKYFNPGKLIMVGFGCGAGGTPSESYRLIEQLVYERDKGEVLEWCKSLMPEVRCLGAIGLKQLEYNGVELSQDEKKMMDLISQDGTLIYYCQGKNKQVPNKSYTSILAKRQH